MVRQLLAVVAELQQRLDDEFVRFLGTVDHRLLDRLVAGRRVEHRQNLRIARLFAGQRRRIGQDRGELVEDLLGHNPFHLLVAGGGIR